MKEAISYIPREQYDRIGRVNFSTLKLLGQSPAHYHYNLLHGQKDTPARKTGRCVHHATFEPEVFRSEYVIWEGGNRTGNAWAAFKHAHRDVEILKPAEHEECLAMAAAVRSDKHTAKYVAGGKAEHTMLWTDPFSGLDCKARPDFIADCAALVDLKTTRSAKPDEFGRDVWKYRYHTQAAFYSDGYFAATGKRLPYVIIAVEKEPPYVVQPYVVPEIILQVGRDEYREWFRLLLECRRASSWPGYGSGEMELSLPRWALPFDDEENLADLDLVAEQ